MSIHNTTNKVNELSELPPLLREMKLSTMADSLQQLLDDPNSQLLSKEEWIKQILMSEYNSRCDKKTMKYLKKAHLKMPSADIHDLELDNDRVMNLEVWYKLTDLEWVNEGLNLIITGPAGVGKTWLSNSLAVELCQKYKTVEFWPLNKLLMELKTLDPKEYLEEMRRIEKLDLLILDDVGLMNYDLEACRIFFELLDTRYKVGSILITSAIPVMNWYELFADNTFGEATLSRAIGNALRLEIQGSDMRLGKK